MHYQTITALSEAIITGEYLAAGDDTPFEKFIFEEKDDFDTALVIREGMNSVSFHPEKQQQSFAMWLHENEYFRKVLSIELKAVEDDTVYRGSAYSVDLNSTLEIPEYLELIRHGTSELNDPFGFESRSLDELLEVFYLIPCGTKDFLSESFLLPVQRFYDQADHPVLDMIRSLFLVMDDENTGGERDPMAWKVARIVKTDLLWQEFYQENRVLLEQWGLTKIMQPGDTGWFIDDQAGWMTRRRLDTTMEELPRLTHQPIFVTRVKPEHSVNFMNDTLETTLLLEGFMNTLFNEGVKEADIAGLVAGFKLMVPATRMQQIFHSFSRRAMKYRLWQRFSDLLGETDFIRAEEIRGFYERRLKEMEGLMRVNN